MQKIEHVMLDVFVILPAPENPYLLSKNRFFNKVIITRLIMYLLKIWQMQMIEQVMLDLSVILPALENPCLIFKKHDLLNKWWHPDDSAWIRRSCFFRKMVITRRSCNQISSKFACGGFSTCRTGFWWSWGREMG